MRAAPAVVREHPRRLFVGLAFTALLVEVAVVHSAGFARRPGLIGSAVTLDLVVLVPALWAWLGVRRGGAPAWSLVPVLVASTAAAALILPPGGEALLDPLLRTAPILEVAVLGWLALRGRRAAAACRASDSPDALVRLREGIAAVFGDHRGFRVLADELSVLRYLVRPPRDRLPDGARSFPYHGSSGWGAVVAALSLAVAAEAAAVHLLVARWSVAAAWGFSALSVYGGLWLAADWRATRRRPLLLVDGRLWLRAGLRWTASLPLERIEAVHRTRRWASAPADDAGAADSGSAGEGDRLDLPVLGGVDLVLELDRPTALAGPFGIERTVTRVGVAVDDPDAFATMLEEERAGHAPDGPRLR